MLALSHATATMLLLFGWQAQDSPDTAPLVKDLLQAPTNDDMPEKSRFFRSLIELAKKNGHEPSDYTYYNSGPARSGQRSSRLTKGSATNIKIQKEHYVLVVTATSGIKSAAEQILLIDSKGKLLDKVACGINGRYGTLKTEVLAKDADDRARIVVSFVPTPRNSSKWHNWHTITYADDAYTFHVRERDKSAPWHEKGLCRIGIEKGKFVIVFPKLEVPDNKK